MVRATNITEMMITSAIIHPFYLAFCGLHQQPPHLQNMQFIITGWTMLFHCYLDILMPLNMKNMWFKYINNILEIGVPCERTCLSAIPRKCTLLQPAPSSVGRNVEQARFIIIPVIHGQTDRHRPPKPSQIQSHAIARSTSTPTLSNIQYIQIFNI